MNKKIKLVFFINDIEIPYGAQKVIGTLLNHLDKNMFDISNKNQ